jgi:hypothetical protein
MKKSKSIVASQKVIAEATGNAIAAVREKAKTEGLQFAMDCAISRIITVPSVNVSVYDLISKAVGNGPHIQKYGLQESAGTAFCDTLNKYGIPARFSISMD